jgi:hypothetical protein
MALPTSRVTRFLQDIETVIKWEQGVSAKGDGQRFFLGSQHRRVRLLRPHRRILNVKLRRTLLPSSTVLDAVRVRISYITELLVNMAEGLRTEIQVTLNG